MPIGARAAAVRESRRSVGRVSLIPSLGALLALLAAPAGLPAVAAGAGTWTWPVDGPVLAPFDYGRDPFARGQHRGVDIGAPAGTPVRAACSGPVTFAGTVGASGRTVAVRCGRHSVSYGHLGAISVREARPVVAGDVLGRVGRSGRPRRVAAHVHLGVRVAREHWGYVDPLRFLGDGPGGSPLVPVPRGRRPHPAVPRLGPVPRGVRVRVPAGARRAPVLRRWPVPVARAGATAMGTGTVMALMGAALLAMAIPLGGLAGRRRLRARRRRVVTA